MADGQAIDITNKDVKTAVDHNTTMIESMFHILQDIQCQNIKIEKRIGGLESDMHSLRTKSNETSKRASPKEPNKRTHQEMEALNRPKLCFKRDKLSSEMKSQTSSLKSNQNTLEQVLTRELQHVKDLAQSQNVQLGTVASIVQYAVPYKQEVMLKCELKSELQRLKTIIQTPSFLKRNDFSSDDEYGKYVKNNARVGMKVRYCYERPDFGIVKGDIGTVTELLEGGLKVDWSPKPVENIVFQVHELIG